MKYNLLRIQGTEVDLHYCLKCIDYMKSSIKKDFHEITVMYEKEKLSIGNNDNVKLEIDDILNDSLTEYRTIAQTFCEALLVRQVATIEHLIINICSSLLPSNSNAREKPKRKEVNIKKAVQHIKQTHNIDFTECESWEIFITMWKLRHQLAHGNNAFQFEDKEVKTFNKKLTSPILILDCNKISYTITDDLSAVQEINEKFCQLLDEMKKVLKK